MVYYFGSTKTEGLQSNKAVLGGKGKNLAEMTSIGLPVPPGFTITTEVCASYYEHGKQMPAGMMEEVNEAVATLEKELDKKFGDDSNPLLVSVRSAPRFRCPA